MLTLLTIVHLMIGLALVLFVLLQDPKGGAMGVFSGGSSSSSFFGASGASNFLTTATRWLAIAFAASCLTLVYVTTPKGARDSVFGNGPATTPPANGQGPSSTPAPSQQQVPGEGAAPVEAEKPVPNAEAPKK